MIITLIFITFIIDKLYRLCKYYIFNIHVTPKQYMNRSKYDTSQYTRTCITRDRYNKNKIPNTIDTIIIGSGIGGLSCAGYLSKVGKTVLVLEQHYIAGGCCHVFEEKGIEHETGIHYVGNINKWKLMLDLITTKPIEWCKMGTKNENVYDEIHIEDKTYLFKAGESNFINELSKSFSEERENIVKYVELVKKVSSLNLFFNTKIIKSKWIRYLVNSYLKYWEKDYYTYINRTTYNVISELTNNEDLIRVLCGQFGDYGITPKKSNFFLHASIANHYLNGGYFPKGGPSEITKNIIPTIEEHGGRVLVGKKVENLIIENNTVKGVIMENGDKIYSKNVVSGIGLNSTLKSLIPSELLESKNIKKYTTLNNNIGNSIGFIYCFINLDGSPHDLDLRDSNLWIYPNKDYESLVTEFEKDITKNPMPMFISSSSAKDTTWENRYPGKSNAIILSMAKKEWFSSWEHDKCTKRSAEYKELKEVLAQRMLNEGLYKYYPKTKGKVTHYEMATPLTNNHYLGCLDGEGYGLESNTLRYSNMELINPATSINNFYLTGQDVCMLGFTGALMGGVLTAHRILGYGTLTDLILNRNLINDLNNMI